MKRFGFCLIPLLAAWAALAAADPARLLLAPLSDGEALELPPLDPATPRPDAVLGYSLGSQFTHYGRILDALGALADGSPRVTRWQYGTTYEGRPLELVAISSPANIQRLEEIRREHLRLADPAALPSAERERLIAGSPLVVWLAYGVHGNESSSSEAAMAVAYVLAAAQGELADLLESTVVLIDPLVNPDGRERYVHFYEQNRGRAPDPLRAASEHQEPWPGGRQNHYLIDLNRDWAWASQDETRQRLAAYQAWEPQVYVDFHEMSSDATYFFPPPAQPVLSQINPRIAAWLDVFGRGNAAAFDRHGWLFYKAESYDLFYPAYGDSYPSLRGAIGMTYEMAGGGRAGLDVALADGSHLTLADRIARHFTTSLATVRTAAKNRRELLTDFVAARTRNLDQPPKVYLWEADQQEASALADLLTRHGIRVTELAADAELTVRPLAGKAPTTHRFPAGSLLVSTAQPLGDLAEALLDLDFPMPPAYLAAQRERVEANLRPEFYDVTAWSLPLAYNVETWRLEAGSPMPPLRALSDPAGSVAGGGDVGWLVRPHGVAGYRLAAALEQQGVLPRLALLGFEVGGKSYPEGTLFIPRHGNPADLGERLGRLSAALHLPSESVSTSYSSSGISLGSSHMLKLRPVRVGLVGGEGVDPTSFGSLWYLLDRMVEQPVTRLDLAALGGDDLDDLDALVLPDGDGYADALGDRAAQRIDEWVKRGGVLVGVGEAVSWLQEHKLTAIKSWEPPKEEKPAGGAEGAGQGGTGGAGGTGESPASGVASRPIYTPGAALATEMRRDHLLTVGLTAPPAVLFQGSTVLLASGDPQIDVLTVASETSVVAGLAWPEAEARLAGSLLVGSESHGSGTVVSFAQEPAFRLFWRATMPLFLNAVMVAPCARGRAY